MTTLIAKQIEEAQAYKNLWALLMPGEGVPPSDQFLRWAGTYDEPVIIRGINRAANKSRKLVTTQPMTLEEISRYASSVMRREQETTVNTRSTTAVKAA